MFKFKQNYRKLQFCERGVVRTLYCYRKSVRLSVHPSDTGAHHVSKCMYYRPSIRLFSDETTYTVFLQIWIEYESRP